MEIGTWGIYACLFIALYFEVFLLISFFEKRPAPKKPTRPTHYPTVDVLVPCWNKGATLGGTIESLLALDYPKDKLNIIVIDDGSTDNTYEAAQKFASEPQVQVYQKKNEGSKYSALNFGLAHSRGELVGCLDADSFVTKDALLEMVKAFENDPSVMAAAPAMKVNKPHSILELMQTVEYTFGIFYKKMFDNLHAISVLPGPFSVYRRSVFAQVGLFRKAHHTEDMEMAFRLHSHGLKLVNVHTALVYTNVPKTVGALVRQRTRWSRGFLENSRDYSYMFFNRRFGHFGILVLPFGLVAFFAGLYSALFAFYHVSYYLGSRIVNYWVTGIPVQLPATEHVAWFYVNTSSLTILIFATMGLTLTAILLGKRIAHTEIPLKSYISYFALFGFVAPLWLARAAWDTVFSNERGWLS